MTGIWELTLIALVVASVVIPYLNKKKEARRIAEAKKRNRYQAPDAKEVDYEEE